MDPISYVENAHTEPAGRPRPITEGCRLRSRSLTSVNHGPERSWVLEQ